MRQTNKREKGGRGEQVELGPGARRLSEQSSLSAARGVSVPSGRAEICPVCRPGTPRTRLVPHLDPPSGASGGVPKSGPGPGTKQPHPRTSLLIESVSFGRLVSIHLFGWLARARQY